MTINEILSADMPTMRRWIGQGWHWWVDQMASMIPMGARLSGHRGPIIERSAAHEGGWRVVGSDQSAPMLSGRRRALVLMALAPDDLLCRTIEAPALGRGELRAMLEMDIDRIGPLPAHQVCFDHEIVARQDDRLTLRIAMAHRARLAGWIGELAAIDIAPTRIALRDADGGLHFDFLPHLDSTAGAASGAWRWWLAVAALFALNLGVMVWRDRAAVDAMRATIEEQAPAGRTALLIHQRLLAEQQRRAQLIKARADAEPLRVLAAVSAALPRGAWVQRLELKGRSLRLVGFAPADVDIVEALGQSPVLRQVADNGGDSAPPTDAGQLAAFDVVASVGASR